MNVEMIEHTTHDIFKRYPYLPSLIGKYQYIYSSDKGKISLIKIMFNFNKVDSWEILCLSGKLFDYTERFSSKKRAEIRIKELLN